MCQRGAECEIVHEMKMQKSNDKYESNSQLFLLSRQSGVRRFSLLLCYTAMLKCE